MRILSDVLAQMPSLAPAWPAVAGLDDDSPVAVCLAAVGAVFDELDRDVPVVDLIPGIRTARDGEGPPPVISELLPAELAVTWRALTTQSLHELLAMPSMGRRRVMRLLAALALVAAEHDVRATVERAVHVIGARVALERSDASMLTALGAFRVDDPVIAAARESLADIPAAAFLTDELRPLVDPYQAASAFLADLDARHRLVLQQRLVTLDPPATLQALADQLGVTRERIRQIQLSVDAQVEAWTRSERASPARAAADRIRQQVGVMDRLDFLPRELSAVVSGEVTPEVGLLLYLAGPYRRDAGWLVRCDFSDWRERVRRVVQEVLGDHRTAMVEECVAPVEELGISPTVAEQAILESGCLRRFGDLIVDWRGNLANRAEVVIASQRRPLSVQDIGRAIDAPVKPRSIVAALATDPRFQRAGTAGWSLTRWNGQRYTGAFSAVLAALDVSVDGRLPLEKLLDDLGQRYGLDAAELGEIASNTPLLIVSDGYVRRRRASEPYRSRKFLKDTRGMFSVEGAWSFRIIVDGGLLRGEPTTIPDSFATYLGMQPGSAGSLAGPVRAVPLSWVLHEPSVGSIRREAAMLDAAPDDLLFVRRATLTDLEFRLVRRADCEVRDSKLRLARLVGADDGAAQDPLTSVGTALGLGGAIAYAASDLVHRLEERGDRDVLEALREVLH